MEVQEGEEEQQEEEEEKQIEEVLRPHKHKHPTKHDVFCPSYIGPWNQNMSSLCFMWSLRPLEEKREEFREGRFVPLLSGPLPFLGFRV